ncbi:unnamed protein product, partial [Tetraodon nigroviridis]
RVQQREGEGQSARRLPEAPGEAADGGGPVRVHGLDHAGRGHGRPGRGRQPT